MKQTQPSTHQYFQTFDEQNEDFQDYLDRLEIYFSMRTESTDDEKVKVFLNLLPPKIFKLVKNLCLPEKPNIKSYSELTELLLNHLDSKPGELAQQHRFLCGTRLERKYKNTPQG